MNKFVIADGKGSFIRLDSSTGKYVPVRNRASATEFEQRSKASNVLNNSVSKDVRKRFHIKTESCGIEELSDAEIFQKLLLYQRKSRRKESNLLLQQMYFLKAVLMKLFRVCHPQSF